MTDSVAWQILEHTQNELRKLDFSPHPKDDGVNGIQKENIVIRKPLKRHADADHGTVNVDKPAIVLTMPSRRSHPQEGVNCDDDHSYFMVIQLLGIDNVEDLTGLRSYLLWEQKIHQRMRNIDWTVIPAAQADVWDSPCQSSELTQDASWYKFNEFITAIEVMVKSREGRT